MVTDWRKCTVDHPSVGDLGCRWFRSLRMHISLAFVGPWPESWRRPYLVRWLLSDAGPNASDGEIASGIGGAGPSGGGKQDILQHSDSG